MSLIVRQNIENVLNAKFQFGMNKTFLVLCYQIHKYKLFQGDYKALLGKEKYFVSVNV